MKYLVTFTVLLAVIRTSVQQATPDSPTYTAGVVEFTVLTTGTPIDQFRINTEQYVTHINSVAAQLTDILVFPESTLNNNAQTAVDIPLPSERIIPCGNFSYNTNLRDLSCAAQRNRKYVVVNLMTRRNCTEEAWETGDNRPCSTDGWNLYNTNVVFDRNGMVISIYRQFNLFNRNAFNTTLVPDRGFFTTDFNVTFGHFTSFDMLFESPAMSLVRENNIQNFVYPARWVSELPFLTAVQMQEGWAIANNVNLLAAGANLPSDGNSGSGIYSGTRGALQSHLTGTAATALLVHVVPRVPGSQADSIPVRNPGQQLHILGLTFDSTPPGDYISQFINTAITDVQNIEVCQESRVNNMCCNFRLRVTPRDAPGNSIQYHYIAAASNGLRSFGDGAEGGVRACAILACTANDVTTCGRVRPVQQLVENNFIFAEVSITARGLAQTRDLAMPNSLALDLLPLPANIITFTESREGNAQFSTAQMNLTAARHDILSFGVYARDFIGSSASQLYMSLFVITVAAVANLLINQIC